MPPPPQSEDTPIAHVHKSKQRAKSQILQAENICNREKEKEEVRVQHGSRARVAHSIVHFLNKNTLGMLKTIKSET